MAQRTDWWRWLKIVLLLGVPLELASLWLFDVTMASGPLNGKWLNVFVLLGVASADLMHYPALKLLPSTAYSDHKVLSQAILFVVGYIDFVLLLAILIVPFYRIIKWCISTRYFGSQ
jgi:hypothetical protein